MPGVKLRRKGKTAGIIDSVEMPPLIGPGSSGGVVEVLVNSGQEVHCEIPRLLLVVFNGLPDLL